ncbi:hypothetical protein [uncultured Vagococcus sp.]|nr:hypothetical protein [uncultured Vagococcus sp.]
MNSPTTKKGYSITGSIYGSLVSYYMIIQFVLNSVQGIMATIAFYLVP